MLSIALFFCFWIALIRLDHYLDDALSDDAMESFANPLVLPQPEIGNLDDIEHAMRGIASTPQGRDALAKFVIGEDYIRKLIPLVEMAEDLESLKDLHWLCNIMKMLILLNDSQIIDHIVHEEVVFGVIGALECERIRHPRSIHHSMRLVSHQILTALASQTILTSHDTRQITGDTSKITRDTRKFCPLQIRTSPERYMRHGALPTLKMWSWQEFLMIQHLGF